MHVIWLRYQSCCNSSESSASLNHIISPLHFLDIPNRFYTHIVQYSISSANYHADKHYGNHSDGRGKNMSQPVRSLALLFPNKETNKQKNSHKTSSSLSGQCLMLLLHQGWRKIEEFLILTLFLGMHRFFVKLSYTIFLSTQKHFKIPTCVCCCQWSAGQILGIYCFVKW